jgi:hypothetical protein
MPTEQHQIRGPRSVSDVRDLRPSLFRPLAVGHLIDPKIALFKLSHTSPFSLAFARGKGAGYEPNILTVSQGTR